MSTVVPSYLAARKHHDSREEKGDTHVASCVQSATHDNHKNCESNNKEEQGQIHDGRKRMEGRQDGDVDGHDPASDDMDSKHDQDEWHLDVNARALLVEESRRYEQEESSSEGYQGGGTHGLLMAESMQGMYKGTQPLTLRQQKSLFAMKRPWSHVGAKAERSESGNASLNVRNRVCQHAGCGVQVCTQHTYMHLHACATHSQTYIHTYT